MKLIKIIMAASLSCLTVQGNEAYVESRYSCISNNRPYFLTMIIALMLCYFSLMMILLHLVAYVLFCPLFTNFWLA